MGVRDIAALGGAVALGLGLASAALAADPAGIWQGAFKVGEAEAKVQLRLEQRRPGMPSCFANFPNRGAETRRCVDLSIEGDKVRFSVPEVNGRYEATLAADGRSMVGTWMSGATPRPLTLERVAEAAAWPTDTADHRRSYVTASDGTWIEVLDFGGEGPPLVMVAGLGASGHVFDAFAPQLKAGHRVYAVTRRGYGLSDAPPTGDDAAYATRRLADDVLQVMDALKLRKPVLVGWSMGGAEITSIAARHPERVAGVVYLDAAYAYSYYAPGNLVPQGMNLTISANAIRAKLRAADAPGIAPAEAVAILDEVMARDIPDLGADLAATRALLTRLPQTASDPGGATPQAIATATAIGSNVERFGPLKVPVLAIFAILKPPANAAEAAARPAAPVMAEAFRSQIDRYKAGNPAATVVEIKDADHAVFRSHPKEVLAAMAPFLAGLE